jgi:prolipoprotein diacylglyceryltransferase
MIAREGMLPGSAIQGGLVGLLYWAYISVRGMIPIVPLTDHSP